MLLDPGPLRLFTDDEIPLPLFRPVFEARAAQEARELEAAGAAIAGEQSTMAGGLSSTLAGSGGLELGAAINAHEDHAGIADTTIGSVAGDADALEAQLQTMNNDTARGLEDAVAPPRPHIPDEAENVDWMDPEYGTIINEYFNKFLGRDAPPDYIDELRAQHQSLQAILAGILGSDEYRARLQQGLVDEITARVLRNLPGRGGGGGGSSDGGGGSDSGGGSDNDTGGGSDRGGAGGGADTGQGPFPDEEQPDGGGPPPPHTEPPQEFPS